MTVWSACLYNENDTYRFAEGRSLSQVRLEKGEGEGVKTSLKNEGSVGSDW